jgi:hypothetical protein
VVVYVVAVGPELPAFAFQTNRFEGMGHATEPASRGSLEGLGLPLIFLFIDDAQLLAAETHKRRPRVAIIEDNTLARL